MLKPFKGVTNYSLDSIHFGFKTCLVTTNTSLVAQVGYCMHARILDRL